MQNKNLNLLKSKPNFFGALARQHNKRKVAFTLAEGATHVARQHNKRRVAFTLAEVLITLGIIGVVSAITMPSLITNYKNKANIAMIRKVYFDLGQVADLALTTEGKKSILSTTLATDPANAFPKYFKVAHTCSGQSAPCFASSYTTLNGGTTSVSAGDNSFMTAAGYSVWPSKQEGRIDVVVDINGSKKPNVAGRDLFGLQIKTNGDITGYGSSGSNECKSSTLNGCNCFDAIYSNNWEYPDNMK